jgi:hypothetical protein
VESDRYLADIITESDRPSISLRYTSAEDVEEIGETVICSGGFSYPLG